jgi:hypothetical protein
MWDSILDTLKDVEQKLEAKICKLMVKKGELLKELHDIEQVLAPLTAESDRVFEEIKKIEKLQG